MATYKVPQDVEADDKLIGPFSFRQFIYLIIVAMAIAIAWALSNIFIGLAIIPLPIVIFFGVLALPLRKDQPMEIYMAALVSFYLKPRLRFWDPEGIESMIEISAPKTVEYQRTKDLSQTEAARRLSYLADIVDSGGWAIRGVSGANGTAMNNDIYLEAQGAEDVLDTNTSIAHSFDQMMQESSERMREEARERMAQATQVTASTPVQAIPTAAPMASTAIAAPTNDPLLSQLSQQLSLNPQGDGSPPRYDPYPNFRQTIIQPLNDAAHQAESDIAPPAPKAAQPAPQSAYHPAPQMTSPQAATQPQKEKEPTTSEATLTAGIMNLANNPDLSIETLAHEAKRLKKKAEEESEEVIISLR